MSRFRNVFPPLDTVIDEVMAIKKMAQGADETHELLRELQDELETIFLILTKRAPEGLDPLLVDRIEALCGRIKEEIQELKGLGTSSPLRWIVEAPVARERLDINLSMYGGQFDSALDARLDRLCPSWPAFYNSGQATILKRGPCAQNTRDDVLNQIFSWIHDPSSQSVFWLAGMAGTGKTTIAYSLCDKLQDTHFLAGSFFCSRLLPECKNITQVIPSIAYQLARFSADYRSIITLTLTKDPDAARKSAREQFKSFIFLPLSEMRGKMPQDAVIVVDGLDECEDKEGVALFLQQLLSSSSTLPVKFIISSRPEAEIHDQMKEYVRRGEVFRLVLHELERLVVETDIETYLRRALEPIQPSELDIMRLVKRSGTLFAYAAAVVRYVGYQNFSKNPRRRLANVLNTSGVNIGNIYKEIDERYDLILEAAIGDPGLDDEDKEDTRRALYTVISAKEPLTIGALSKLTGLEDVERVRMALRPLCSVLHIHESSGLVSSLHASLFDYISDPARAKSYYCDPTAQNYILAQRCFDCIQDVVPQFNICRLESSFIPDSMVGNLAERVGGAISQELSYACRHWATHLVSIKASSSIVKQLEKFLSVRLLLWMEILNLQGCLDTGVEALRRVENWCTHQACSEELIYFVHDAWRFVMAFTASPASRSTPHIYVSMLPFWPESNPVAKHFATRMRGGIIPPGAPILKRQSALLATWNVGGPVTSVAWSPSGTQVALVLEGQICVWESVTGAPVLNSITQSGHHTRLIAFSPDGRRIASASPDGSIWEWDMWSRRATPHSAGQVGWVHSIVFSGSNICTVTSSDDKTIRIRRVTSGKSVLLQHSHSIRAVAHTSSDSHLVTATEDGGIYLWDAQSGEILGSFMGHVGSVTSLSISVDGNRIVSGSDNNNIYVWDQSGRNSVPVLLEGHSGSITSVALSHNGARIASGSKDTTVRLWDAATGDMLLGPLMGHTNSVNLLTFSPDSGRIVSSSDDGTVRIWDTYSKPGVLNSLLGHKGSVTSVAFYRTSAKVRVVSGSDDETIRVWDARSGKLMLGPLTGHTGSVKSVVISPDGTRIASGSDDSTVRVWNAETGQMLLAPLVGHTGSVASVAFSPNGTLVISGSFDKTIRIWDSKSGQPVLEPLVGHSGSVTTIAPSPHGSHILSGSSDKTLRLWDLQSGQPALSPFEGHDGCVTSVAFSPDGTRIASSSSDNTICIWEPQAGKKSLAVVEGHDGWVTSVAFSTGGDCVISGSWDMTICVWDVKSKRKLLGPLRAHKGPVTSVAISLDETCIVSGSSDTTICVWDAQNGSLKLDPLEGHTAIVTSVALSADGSRIISGSGDRTVRVWDGRNGQMTIEPLTGHEDWVVSVALSPDGSQVVSGSSDSTVRIWDPVGGQMLFGPLSGHTESVMSVAFSPDGRCVVSGSGDQSIRIWNARNGQPVLGPLKGHRGWVTSVSVSPDGNYLASGSSDKTIYLWSMLDGGVLLHFRGHTSWVSSIAFSPDGAYIVSGAWDKTIRLWDAQNPREPLSVIKGHTNSVTSLSFSPDSTCIVSGSNDKTIRMWDLQSGQMVLGPLEGHTGMVTCVGFSPDGTRIVSGCTEGIIRLWDTVSRGSQPRALPPGSDSAEQSSLTINKDGWIVDRNKGSRMLAWVPPEIRHALLLPRDTLLASGNEFVRLDFSRALVGEAWTGCYQVPDGLS